MATNREVLKRILRTTALAVGTEDAALDTPGVSEIIEQMGDLADELMEVLG